MFSDSDRSFLRQQVEKLLSDLALPSAEAASVDTGSVVRHLEDCVQFRDHLRLFDIADSRKQPLDKFLLESLLKS